MAEPLHRFKRTDNAGGIEEHVVWKVPKTDLYPDGIRYRLVYVRSGSYQPLVLYDNHYPKGHHRHICGREEPYLFLTFEKLLEDFRADVGMLKWIH